MTEPVDPIRRLDRVSRAGRAARAADRAADAQSTGRDLVPVAPPRTHESRREPRPQPAGDAAFSAQLLGGAPRRGLKGGPETLEQARSTYLQNEYSGPSDRRAKLGQEKKTDV